MGSTSPAPPSAAGYDVTQEVRFAVVMYGGVSLAIYINGIAQELLRAVRATADLPSGSALASTESVYRKIGQILHHGRKPGDNDRAPQVRARIVVDLLSGTSAGGINSIFLAKALALRCRNLDRLKQMWMEEANIHLLLNDKASEPEKYPPRQPKTSLLNSQRMYAKLLEAFRSMNSPDLRDPAGGQPLADQIDLYVTATDLNGVYAPIELADRAVDERIHRAVFRFEHDELTSTAISDFTADYDEMLAFAARCTSSFPGAFEPMKFTDMALVGADVAAAKVRFSKFFARYNALDVNFEERPFADGGYLDNKPFSYVIERIPYRSSDLPVERKLLFVDPFPEFSGDLPYKSDFNFLENSLAAATGLPGYETIRADIDEVNRRNRILERLARLQDRAAHDRPRSVIRPGAFREKDLQDLIDQYGDAYATYHHLKVYGITDWLARVMTRVSGLNEDSDHFRAERYLARIWRHRNFSAYRQPDKETENIYLSRFDLDFRMRRLNHLLSRIDELSIEERLAAFCQENGLQRDAVWDELRRRRRILREQLIELRNFRRRIESRTESPLRAGLQMFKGRVRGEELKSILAPSTDQGRMERAAEIYQRYQPLFLNLADTLARLLGEQIARVRKNVQPVVNPAAQPSPASPEARQVVLYLWSFYQGFEQHDMTTLVFLAGTQAQETAPIEVFRVSPADTFLKPDTYPRGDQKLAGVAVGHFGAFLAGGWRENDMMWGRLDGAERIITALLPDEADAATRQSLIEEAQRTILEEELSPQHKDRIFRWLAQQLRKSVKPDASETELAGQLKRMLAAPQRGSAGLLLETLFRGLDYIDFVRTYYEKPSGPEPKEALKWAGRATHIVGEMFQGLGGADDSAASRAGRRLSFAGTLLTHVVELALPGSFGNVFARYWGKVLMIASVLLILLGPLLGQETATVGWVGLVLYGSLVVFYNYLQSKLSGKGSIWQLTSRLVGLVAILMALLGAWTAATWVISRWDWVRQILPALRG